MIPAPLINFYGGMISPLNQAQVQGICPLPHLTNLCLCETGWWDAPLQGCGQFIITIIIILISNSWHFLIKIWKWVEFTLGKKKITKFSQFLCWKVAKFHPQKNIGSSTNECHGYILSMVLISCEEGCIQSVFFLLSGGPLWLALNQKSCSHYVAFHLVSLYDIQGWRFGEKYMI